MTKHLPRRRAILALAASALTASCSESAPNPDPGNRRLHALAADPIFAILPPGAVRTRWEVSPAKYQDNSIFEGSGWAGPSVILTFTSSLPPRDVYHFYSERSAEDGWTPWPSWEKPPKYVATVNWTKRISEEKTFLSLDPHFNLDFSAGGGLLRSYALTAA